MTTSTPVPCDCINWCGDDPWLRDGRATPCAALLMRDEKEARLIDRQINTTRLLDQLGHAGDTLAALQELERLRRDQRHHCGHHCGHLVSALRRLMREAVEHCDTIKIEGAIAEAADALEAS